MRCLGYSRRSLGRGCQRGACGPLDSLAEGVCIGLVVCAWLRLHRTDFVCCAAVFMSLVGREGEYDRETVASK